METKPTHTPGPWTSYGTKGHYEAVIVRVENEGTDAQSTENVADVWNDGDANLIAAAPDMLAALRKISDEDGGSLPTWAIRVALTAIAKAEGH